MQRTAHTEHSAQSSVNKLGFSFRFWVLGTVPFVSRSWLRKELNSTSDNFGQNASCSSRIKYTASKMAPSTGTVCKLFALTVTTQVGL